MQVRILAPSLTRRYTRHVLGLIWRQMTVCRARPQARSLGASWTGRV